MSETISKLFQVRRVQYFVIEGAGSVILWQDERNFEPVYNDAKTRERESDANAPTTTSTIAT